MYIIRKKNRGDIVFISSVDMQKQADPMDVYPEFNRETMEIGWHDSKVIPEHFDITKDGLVVALSLSEQVEQGLIQLTETQKIEDEKIVDKTEQELIEEGVIQVEEPPQPEEMSEPPSEQLQETLDDIDEPFEYIQDNLLYTRTLAEVIEGDLLKTKEQAEKALRKLDRKVEKKVALKYSSGYELKLTKRYMEWQLDGKPENDRREQKYIEMRQEIDAVRKEFKPLREKVKNLLTTL